jgi:hemoglobin
MNKILLLLLAVITIFVLLRQNRPKSLYERLGGVYPIAAVVNRFSDELIKNPKVGAQSPNPALRRWSTTELDRLPGLKFMRTLWVCDITGGPYKFISTNSGTSGICPFSLNLKNIHKDFHITSDEFDEVASELSKALDFYHVPEKEKGEVLAAFAAHKKEVVQI